ncbi:membrin-11 isoform X2 [Medicago truncatula]|uniref:Bos1/membrin family Qb-SNARE protein n=1 Tax=Medicago truncatula TaxID=3880 RepID=A0A072URA9_MEDTR|nr:membrin-11 isoform X2 [Medicago truncatula]KEH28395.1 Bos1/membrin family Qb-SNARE protein [Medicago truncatula]
MQLLFFLGRYNTIEGVAVYDTCRCLTLTDVNTLNHVIFSNYYWCRRECPISVLHTDTLDWRKVEQIAEEAESLRESLEKYNSRNHKRMMEAKEREELLGRVNGDPSHVLRIFDDDTQAMLSVRNSARELENANALGETILSSIHGQRERLKSAHRKALDVLNTAGISNRVLRLIERRNRVDQWIKYAGMILTVIFLFAFVLWRR